MLALVAALVRQTAHAMLSTQTVMFSQLTLISVPAVALARMAAQLMLSLKNNQKFVAKRHALQRFFIYFSKYEKFLLTNSIFMLEYMYKFNGGVKNGFQDH